VGKASSDVSTHEVVFHPKYVTRFAQTQSKIAAAASQDVVNA
jgi:hypothetical protein